MNARTRLDRLESRDDDLVLYRKCNQCGLVVLNGMQNESDDPCQHDANTILYGRADIVIKPLNQEARS